jgi:hypothetical protein
MRWIDQSTEEDMQNKPSPDNQNPPIEHITGPIEVCCRADGVFGQDVATPAPEPGSHARPPP